MVCRFSRTREVSLLRYAMDPFYENDSRLHNYIFTYNSVLLREIESFLMFLESIEGYSSRLIYFF